jgi:hypothetical protein
VLKCALRGNSGYPIDCVSEVGDRAAFSRKEVRFHVNKGPETGLDLRRTGRERHLQSREIYPKLSRTPPALTFPHTSLFIKVVRSSERKIDERLRPSTSRIAENR